MEESRTGKIAEALGVNNKTIHNWSDIFSEFITPKGRGIGVVQRLYTENDLYVLNTVRAERARGTEWDKIRARLAAGDLDKQLPPQAATMDGNTALAVYAEVRSLQAQLLLKDSEIEYLREQVREKDEALRERDQAVVERIDQLTREAERWKVRYEILREQMDNDTSS